MLLSAALLIHRYHDTTAGLSLRGDAEIVCHGNTAVALIDWDADVGPGYRGVDYAHAVWCLADLCDESVPVAEQARRARLKCSAYPCSPRPR